MCFEIALREVATRHWVYTPTFMITCLQDPERLQDLEFAECNSDRFPGGSEVSVCPECGRPGFNPWVGKIPWRRKWQPTPVLLPGESHGGRSLVGYSPQGRKELDTTERLHFHFHSWLSLS